MLLATPMLFITSPFSLNVCEKGLFWFLKLPEKVTTHKVTAVGAICVAVPLI